MLEYDRFNARLRAIGRGRDRLKENCQQPWLQSLLKNRKIIPCYPEYHAFRLNGIRVPSAIRIIFAHLEALSSCVECCVS